MLQIALRILNNCLEHITGEHNRLQRVKRGNHTILDVQEVMELEVVEQICFVLNDM